jgi:hypothetical protein
MCSRACVCVWLDEGGCCSPEYKHPPPIPAFRRVHHALGGGAGLGIFRFLSFFFPFL